MAKLTRNSYKRKIILFGVFVFMSIALISTGFAAWVMSADDKVEDDGNVDVGVVKDSTIDIIFDDENYIKNFEFLFEPAAGDVKAEGNRVHLEEVEEGQTAPSENLKLTIKGTISNPGNLAQNGLKIKMVLPAGLAKASELNYIVLPTCVEEQVINVNENGEFTYVVEFTWGSAFGGMNPSLYYDNDATGKEVSNQEVRKTLENLRACVYNYYTELNAEGADRAAIIAEHLADEIPTYKITITATAK